MNNTEKSQRLYKIGLQATNIYLYDVAIEYLTKAAELGNADAMYLLGNIYDEAKCDYDYDLHKENERIVSNYKCAADKGCKKAFIEVALRYLDEDNLECNKRAANKWFKMAISWNQSAAEKGDPVAMLAIAEVYSRYNFSKTLRYGGLPNKDSLSDRWRKFAFARR